MLYLHKCVHVYLYVYVHTWVYACMCIYTCVHLTHRNVCVCMYREIGRVRSHGLETTQEEWVNNRKEIGSEIRHSECVKVC